MSATTRAAIATFTGVGLIFGGALFAAGSAMAAAAQHTGQTGAANECPVGQSYDYSEGECRQGNPGQPGASATGHGGQG